MGGDSSAAFVSVGPVRVLARRGRGLEAAEYGVLFAVYHLHTPWVIPSALVDIIALAYRSRRFESAWMGIIVHSTQSVIIIIIIIIIVLAAVLG